MIDEDNNLGLFSISDMVEKSIQQHVEKFFKGLDATKKYKIDQYRVFENGNWVFKTTAVEMPPRHVTDTYKTIERKLKPVDENCLYKKVIGLCTENPGLRYQGTLIDIIKPMDNYNIFVLYTYAKSSSSLLYQSDAGINIHCVSAKRLIDVDYGDGGNYEI